MKKQKRDIYQEITNQIIEALEQGVKPWVCPWNREGSIMLPFNLNSGKAYNGVNILVFWMAAHMNEYSSNAWLTFQQARNMGGHVRKGEKGTTGIYYNFHEKEDERTGEKKTVPFVRTFTVFNIDQIEGIEQEKPEIEESEGFDPIAQADTVINNSGAIIRERGAEAYYSPTTDMISMPERKRFANAGNYYATLLHELTHWTGHEKRLNRDIKNKFGTPDYAFEELVADIGSCILCQTLGIEGEFQHESYIASWLKALKNDKTFVIKAANLASKAHRFLMPEFEADNSEEEVA